MPCDHEGKTTEHALLGDIRLGGGNLAQPIG